MGVYYISPSFNRDTVATGNGDVTNTFTRSYRDFRVRLVQSTSQTVDQVPSSGTVLLLERLPKLGPVAGLERYEPHDRMFGRFPVRPGHEKPERREPFGRVSAAC